MKKTKYIAIFNQGEYDGEWPPEDAKEFFAFFASKISEIPEQYRDNAIINISSVSGYEGYSCAHIEIAYKRLETDQEEQIREGQEQAREDSVRRRELNELSKLKAKYPDA